VNVVDANVLLYAVNEQSDRHDEARAWLDASLSGGAVVGFSWIAMLAFVRLSTKAHLFPRPLSASEAFDRLDAWTAAPAASVIEPTAGHLGIVRRLLDAAGTAGNLVNDAHLAALSIEHRGVVVSYDGDFARFPGVQWTPPRAA
jgi:toxin-antitoxin system PIN domain toxin